MKIQESIARGATTLLQLAPLNIIAPEKPIPINADNCAQQIKQLSEELAMNIGYIPMRGHEAKVGGKFKAKSGFMGKQLEFSPHLALRSMASAHALKNKRIKIEADDIDFLVRLLRFTRYDRPGML